MNDEEKVMAWMDKADAEGNEEPETEETEELEETVDASDGEQSEDQAETQSQTQSEELEDVELNGKAFKVPAEVKKSLMQERDYTTKAQELAEQRKQVEIRDKQTRELGEFQKQIIPEMATLKNLEQQIAEYGRLDWTSLNTDEMVRYRHAVETLKEQKTNLQQALSGKFQEFQKGQENHRKELAKMSEEYLKKTVPNWGSEVAKEIANYANESGFTEDELGAFDNPKLIRAMYKAMRWDALQKSKNDVSQKAKTAPPVLKPGVSNPLQKTEMNDAAYRKAIKSAKSSREKNSIVMERLMKKI